MKPVVAPELPNASQVELTTDAPVQDSQKQKRQGWVLAAGLVGMFVYARLNLPGPPCLFRTFLHVPCPGCGLTRSIIALSHLDFLTSFRYHPLGLPLVIVAALWALHTIVNRSRTSTGVSTTNPLPRKPRLPERAQSSLWWALLALMLSVWIMRLVLAAEGNHFFMW